MSKQIDERVVEMRFDNKDFESNVKTSMSTLSKLKQSLKLDGASKGLENVGTAAKKLDLNPIGNAVQAISVKFSALEVMGVTALANITNSAVNAGKRIISALTIDPIKTGFAEYETQINAVQTILANTQSKGSTLSQVNAALDELNKYADMTIYNFTEMTRNIGTFTAAGVDLDKSVSSIKGIANLAAVSGSTSQQASTAMYQLSQALAAGKVQLMDWNSVVNAGMGGQLFQDALKRTATQMGHNVDELIEKYGSFRESLTKGNWLTAEVLTETLTQLSGAYSEADLIAQGYSEEQAKQIVELAETAVNAATKVKTFTQLWDTLKEAAQSGWTETWEILVGDFEEAKAFLTELSDTFGAIIGKSADARNQLLYDAMASNWKKLTDEITEAGLSAEDFKDKVTEIAKSKGLKIDEIIADYGSLEAAFKNGALSSDLLDQALIKMTGTTSEINKKLTDLRGEYKSNEDIIKALTKAGYEQADMQELVAKSANGEKIALNDLTDAQLMSIGYTADQVKNIRELSRNAEIAGGSLKDLTKNISEIGGRELLISSLRVTIRSLISVFETLGEAWREVFPPATADQVYGIAEAIHNFALSLRPTEETLDKLKRTFKGLFSVIDIVRQALSAILSPFGIIIGNVGALSGGILGLTARFGDWLVKLNESIKAGNSFSVIGDTISYVLNLVTDSIHFVIGSFDGFEGVLNRIGTVVSKVFSAIKNTISSVLGWIRENISAGDIFAGLAGGGIFALAKKFSNFIDSIKESLSNLFGSGSDKAKTKFSDILDSLHGSLESFQQGINVASLIGIATAVTLLSSALRTISEIEPVKIAYSLATIGAMIAMLNGGFKSLTKTLKAFDSKGALKSSASMVIIASAINVLASALTKISGLDFSEIMKGLVGIGGLLLELSVAVRLMGKGGVTLRTSVAILALAKACEMLGNAMSKFSALSWSEISRGLAAMGGALTELVISLKVLSKVGGFGAILGGTGILIAVQALDEISENLERLGAMSWKNIGRGLTAMGGALAEFVIALGALSKVGGFGSILGGTAILIVVQALDEISENLKRLGSMTWSEIGKGLSAMGGALAELAIACGGLGKIAGFSGILGAGAILLVIQGLSDITDALQKFGSMSWGEIGRGLTAMAGALAETGLAAALTGFAGMSGIFGAGAILMVIQGLEKLANSLKKFGSMTWSEIGRGLTAMAGALTVTGLASALTGFAGLSGIIGGGAILLTVQSLGDLADALKKFGDMSWDEIGRGLTAMGAALGETALGGILNTFSGFGASSISTIAKPLGDLADSVKRWQNVSVPDDLGMQIGSLANGIMEFTFGGSGAKAIATIAAPLGNLATSISKWSGITVPEELGTQIGSLAEGIKAFTFGGWGADTLASAAPAIGSLAMAVKKWSGVTIPDDLEEGLVSIANGIKAFSFAFVGGWSLDSIRAPLSDLADVVNKWKDVKVPSTIDEDLSKLADGVKSFSFAFVGSWSIDSVKGPLGDLADSVKKWIGINITGIGPQLNELSEGLSSLKNTNINVKFSNNIREFFNVFADSSISASVSNIKSIVFSLSSMSSIDPGGISKFSDALENLGKISISGLVSSINSGASEVGAAIQSLVSAMVIGITGSSVVMSLASKTAGKAIGTNLSSGIKEGTSNLSSIVSNNMRSVISTIKGQNKSFVSVGESFGTSLTSGIKSSISQLPSFISSSISKSMSAIFSQFNSAGKNMSLQLASGINSGSFTIITAFTQLVSSALTQVKNRYNDFISAGETLMVKLIAGIRAKSGAISSAFIAPLGSSLTSIRNYYGSFYNAGGYLVQGFAAGITANTFAAQAAAAAMARAAYNSAMSALRAASPSKLFIEVGSYVPMGFAKGISTHATDVKESSYDMANTAINTTRDALSKLSAIISSDIDTEPRIRPIIDLSDAENKARRLNTLFTNNQALSINASMNSRKEGEIQNGVSSSKTNYSIQFVQNNNSPKALSRGEIYRQTKNQISMLERKLPI